MTFAAIVPAAAVINGNGYYRVQNAKTERYIYVLDDKGSLNFQATTAELGAIQLWKDYAKTVSDPATIIYLVDLNGKNQDFDLQAQGTGVHAIIDYPVSIRLYDKKKGTYQIFGRNSGLTRYIGDGTRSTADRGYVTSLENGEYYRWYFVPVDNENNYFGVTPEIAADGKYYSTLYADFGYTFLSPGMKAYTVCNMKKDEVQIKEVEGAVAKGTPVIIESQSPNAVDNRLNIGAEGQPVSDNILRGLYFCNYEDALHYNFIEYNKATMRVLGKLSDGSVGFTTADLKYVPRNRAYLVVPEGTPEELHLTTRDLGGFDDAFADAADVRVNGMQLTVTTAEKVDVYNLAGYSVYSADNAAAGVTVTLPAAGIYFVRTGSNLTKVMAR